MPDRSDHMSLLEVWDALQPFITGPALVAGAIPGMLLCAPGLIFFMAPLLVTLVLMAVVLSLVAVPVMTVYALVSIAHRRRDSRRRVRATSSPLPTSAQSA